MWGVMDIYKNFGSNSGYIQELYDLFKIDPALVGSTWAEFFKSQEISNHENLTTLPVNHSGSNGVNRLNKVPDTIDRLEIQAKVIRLIDSYRTYGHYKAAINPLKHDVPKLPWQDELSLEHYKFDQKAMSLSFSCDNLGGSKTLTLNEIISYLNNSYCGSIGFEYIHLLNSDEREWIRQRIEAPRKKASAEDRVAWLRNVVEARVFESELHRKYIGAKRFSLEGGESLIPLLTEFTNVCSKFGVKEIIYGMAHRGRLNVLANVMGRKLEQVLLEFDDRTLASAVGAGDVKYHQGFDVIHATRCGESVRLALAPNPSHLEFVNPVVEGMVRARQDIAYNCDRSKVVPILIHGDAAFIGQGVVAETLNLAKVPGYCTGGTVHVVINNQIGFTATSDETRSTPYCTDIAKVFDAPVFHVNAEDVDAVCFVALMAAEFRCLFRKDVVIDLYCYRKYGHNEGDDPSYTQPLSTKEIKSKEPIDHLYNKILLEDKIVDSTILKTIEDQYKGKFAEAVNNSNVAVVGEGCATFGRPRVAIKDTNVSYEDLLTIANTSINFPENFTPHPKLEKLLEKRVQTFLSGKNFDWALGEYLAFGSLLKEGVGIRLSGQDVGRGTFSHRHIILDDYERQWQCYNPLSSVGNIEVINSVLSEAAVLGFEFGYSAEFGNCLVLWEAQFGDFANGAQVIIDQFISSSEAKWGQESAVVLLLPHGYEGQGPEHSSARLERFLQLCADGNMEVCVPTTPAQYFHLLRRQMYSISRRPLVIMTPKSILRHPVAVNSISDFTESNFKTIIPHRVGDATSSIKTILFMSGKVYYDVIEVLEKNGVKNTLVVRVEQLNPFPSSEIRELLDNKTDLKFAWVQEEPKNQGGWSFVEPRFKGRLVDELSYIGRPVSPSTATGSSHYHNIEKKRILDACIELSK
jgi:2-oxoglutarate dehydrogenase E1 component